MKKIAVVYFALSLFVVTAFGQVNSGLLKTLTAIAGMRERLPIEKLYLQSDKPYYTSGDTIRFKSYLINADFLKSSTKSGLLYVELDDANNTMVKRIMIPLTTGIGCGNIALDEKEVPEGSYTLRAYTNWMLNFGEDYIFRKSIYISPIHGGSTLIKSGFKLEDAANKSKVTAGLLLTDLNGVPLRLKDIRLKVMNGKHILIRDKANTGMDGIMHINFDLTDRTTLKNLSIQAQQTGKGADTATLTIPVTINRVENTDVQFLPEGGNMVAGIAAKIAFKAISEDGTAVTISGKIINNKQQEVASFRSEHKGMGSFELIPQAGENYTAQVTLPNNMVKSYPLPAVNVTGTTLRVNIHGKDSLELVLNATATQTAANYYLVGQTRGLICYTSLISFKGAEIKKTIAKDLFPTGIAHFTLLSSTEQPLNERIVYIDHKDNLRINISQNKSKYMLRDSIALNIKVSDKNGKPVHGTFSVAVTDDSQVRQDSTHNIISDLLLTTDLKGEAEEPGWYFEKSTADRILALDNLLLTQGWIGYDWKAIFDPKPQPPLYSAELEFAVKGKLTNLLNKPLKQTSVTLLQKQPLLAMEMLTNDNGQFIFKGKALFPTDSAFYIIQAKNKNGDNKTFNVGVNVDEFIPPVYKPLKKLPLPWYFNTDTTLLNNANTKMAQLKAEAAYKGEGHMLKEVVIKTQKIIPESHNLNGPGGADIILDEAEMNKYKNQTLYELLKDKFKDFHKIEHLGNTQYRMDYRFRGIYDIVIDGVFISELHLPQDLYMELLKASDIKGIEIMTTGSYGSAYAAAYMAWLPGPPPVYDPSMVFLEVTTYSGHGAFLKKTPGRYIYKPIPMSFPKQFYSPKYTAANKNLAPGTDLRSTIHWEPNVVTDKEGKATISFFSADKAADYSIILEGTDLNGQFGYSRQKVKVISK